MRRDFNDYFSSKSARNRSKDDRQLVIIPADNVPAYLIREQNNKETHTRHLMDARWRRSRHWPIADVQKVSDWHDVSSIGRISVSTCDTWRMKSILPWNCNSFSTLLKQNFIDGTSKKLNILLIRAINKEGKFEDFSLKFLFYLII